MFIRKMDAIKCIISLAEELSEQFEFNETIADNFTYYSSKYSNVSFEGGLICVQGKK